MKVVVLSVVFFLILVAIFVLVGYTIASLPFKTQGWILISADAAAGSILIGLIAFIAAKVVTS